MSKQAIGLKGGPRPMLDVNALEHNWNRWEQIGRNWGRLDRVHTTEDQVIALSEPLLESDYFSSETLLHPSIPEFTAIVQDAAHKENTYVMYRRSLLTAEDVKTMAKDPILFALSNPVPEILPEEAYKGGAAIVGTGRSDLPNQINNVLAFPGIFRGALDVRASDINEAMKLAAAKAIAGLVGEKLSRDMILPEAFDPRVGKAVAAAVAQAARDSGVARI